MPCRAVDDSAIAVQALPVPWLAIHHMTKNDQHFEEFKPHTLLKHAILESYVVMWAMKLIHAADSLFIIDAFAGAGRDLAGHEGSPLIAARRAAEAMQAARQQGMHPHIHVHAIEKSAAKHRDLSVALAPYIANAPDLIHVHAGQLSDHIDEIKRTARGRPSFYFLDPFGISGLDARTYPTMLAGERDEIFVLFSDIGAVRLHGLVTRTRPDATKDLQRILTSPSLFPEFDVEEISQVEQEAARVAQALDATLPASRAHLTSALGSEAWIQALEGVPPSSRGDVFLRLFREALLKAGARHVLTIPMRNDAGQRVYALVHASKSVAGFVAMKWAVSAGLGQASLSAAMTSAIKRQLSVDVPGMVLALERGFAAQEVPWTGEDGLQEGLLAHTSIFPFQMKEVKAALSHCRILRRKSRREVCVFPPKKGSSSA